MIKIVSIDDIRGYLLPRARDYQKVLIKVSPENSLGGMCRKSSLALAHALEEKFNISFGKDKANNDHVEVTSFFYPGNYHHCANLLFVDSNIYLIDATYGQFEKSCTFIFDHIGHKSVNWRLLDKSYKLSRLTIDFIPMTEQAVRECVLDFIESVEKGQMPTSISSKSIKTLVKMLN